MYVALNKISLFLVHWFNVYFKSPCPHFVRIKLESVHFLLKYHTEECPEKLNPIRDTLNKGRTPLNATVFKVQPKCRFLYYIYNWYDCTRNVGNTLLTFSSFVICDNEPPATVFALHSQRQATASVVPPCLPVYAEEQFGCFQTGHEKSDHSGLPSHIMSKVRLLGWGLLWQFSPFSYFSKFSALWIQSLAIEYHIYIWQVSPQLCCGGTCQIRMWLQVLSKDRIFCCQRN